MQSGNILVQSVALAQNALTVTFSPEGTWLLGLGQLSLMGNGSRPILVDAAGRIVEHARLTSNVIQTVAAISSAVVSVAHVISAADLAHRMKQMEPKLDLLIAYRRIDQEAKLERVFYAARELCAGPISPDERQRLWQLRQELRELRIVLRKEWQRELEQIAQQQVAPLESQEHRAANRPGAGTDRATAGSTARYTPSAREKREKKRSCINSNGVKNMIRP